VTYHRALVSIWKPRFARHLFYGITSDDFHFNESLQSEDELGAVVRAQLHIEARLDRLLMKRLDPSAADTILSDEHRTIHTWKIRVDWAYALGLMREPMYRMLLEVGRLRDRFAHNLYKQIERSDLDRLVARLTPDPGGEPHGARLLLRDPRGEDALHRGPPQGRATEVRMAPRGGIISAHRRMPDEAIGIMTPDELFGEPSKYGTDISTLARRIESGRFYCRINSYFRIPRFSS
jgi:hypothetical protein